MNGFVDAETNRKLKDKRTEQRKKKQHNKQKDFDKYIDDSLELLLQKKIARSLHPNLPKPFETIKSAFNMIMKKIFMNLYMRKIFKRNRPIHSNNSILLF